MEHITLGRVALELAFLVGLITSIEFIFIRIKNFLGKLIKEETLQRCKYDLITTMSRIQNGYIPTSEEKRMLIETKEIYNKMGGDGYVDNMFDNLKKEGLI